MRVRMLKYILGHLDRKQASKVIESVFPGYAIKKIRADAGTKKAGKGNKSECQVKGAGKS